MSFEEIARARRSTRAFLDKEVPEAVLQQVLETALTAPSSTNTQGYRIAIAQGALKDKIAQELTSKYDGALKIKDKPLPIKAAAGVLTGVLPNGDYKPDINYPGELKQRAIACGKGLYGTLGIERGDRAARDMQMRKNFEFFGAPVAMFLFIQGDRNEWGALDGGIFLQTLMLAASDLGLGTCAQGALALWGGTVKRHFNVEKGYKLMCGLSLGYPADDVVNTFQPEKRSVSELCLAPR